MKRRIIIVAAVILAAVVAVLIATGVFEETETIVVASGSANVIGETATPPPTVIPEATEYPEPEEDTEYEYDNGFADSPEDSGNSAISHYTPQPTKKPVIIEVPDEKGTASPTPTPTPVRDDNNGDSTESDDVIGRIAF